MKIAIISLLFMACMGCASVKYTNTQGESFKYSRLGLQSLNDFKMTKDEKGLVKVSFSKQEGGENIGEIVKNVTDVAMTAMTKIP